MNLGRNHQQSFLQCGNKGVEERLTDHDVLVAVGDCMKRGVSI